MKFEVGALTAGTGKLVARGLDVVAVEPLEKMRAELARALQHVQVLAGTAEVIPLPDWRWDGPGRRSSSGTSLITPVGPTVPDDSCGRQ